MFAFLPLVLLIFNGVVVIWDVVLTGRMAQVRTLPRPFVFLPGLAGFLLVPALVIHLATSDAVTGRSVTAVDWLWPVTVVLFALQAIYAGARRLVNPFVGFFVALYDIIVASDAVLRFVPSRGTPLPEAALVVLAATSSAFAFLSVSPTIIASPLFFFVPMTAPAYPALRPSAATFRVFLALVAFGWIVVILSRVFPADQAVNSYGAHDSRREKLQERPANDFDIGLKLFPDLEGGPPPVAIANDIALADSIGVTVVSVTVVPEAMDRAALDSLAHTLDELRSDSTQLIVTMGYHSGLIPLPGRNFSERRRLAAIGPIVRHLRPDILIPAKDPYTAGSAAAGVRPPQFWETYLTRAAAEAHRVDRRVRIGVAASLYESRDSALYAWAASPSSPVDVVGFTLYPSPSGVIPLDASGLDEVVARDRLHLRRGHGTNARVVLGKLRETAEEIRIHHVAEHCAAALLANCMGADRVGLRLLELARCHRFIAQAGKFAEQPRPRDLLQLGRRGDVRHERTGERPLHRACVHRIRQRLLVAQLIEEAATVASRMGYRNMSSLSATRSASAIARSVSSAASGMIACCATSASNSTASAACGSGTLTDQPKLSPAAPPVTLPPRSSPSSAICVAVRRSVPLTAVRAIIAVIPASAGSSSLAPPSAYTPA